MSTEADCVCVGMEEEGETKTWNKETTTTTTEKSLKAKLCHVDSLTLEAGRLSITSNHSSKVSPSLL